MSGLVEKSGISRVYLMASGIVNFYKSTGCVKKKKRIIISYSYYPSSDALASLSALSMLTLKISTSNSTVPLPITSSECVSTKM